MTLDGPETKLRVKNPNPFSGYWILKLNLNLNEYSYSYPIGAESVQPHGPHGYGLTKVLI